MVGLILNFYRLGTLLFLLNCTVLRVAFRAEECKKKVIMTINFISEKLSVSH